MVASRRSWTAVIALCVAAPVAAQDRALAVRSVDIRVTDTGFAPAEIRTFAESGVISLAGSTDLDAVVP